MPLVLRRDLKGFEKLLAGVQSKSSPWIDVFYKVSFWLVEKMSATELAVSLISLRTV